jgi:hypothetical protein
MAEITSSNLDDEHWATSDGVREYIDIPVKGGEKDVEPFITSATDTVQAWWKRTTDGDIPDDLPPGGSIEDDHPLLVKATELLAASEAHEANAQNFRSEQDDGQERHVYLERRAESKFDDWVTVHGYGATDTTEAQGTSYPATGRTAHLTNYGGDYGE